MLIVKDSEFLIRKRNKSQTKNAKDCLKTDGTNSLAAINSTWPQGFVKQQGSTRSQRRTYHIGAARTKGKRSTGVDVGGVQELQHTDEVWTVGLMQTH